MLKQKKKYNKTPTRKNKSSIIMLFHSYFSSRESKKKERTNRKLPDLGFFSVLVITLKKGENLRVLFNSLRSEQTFFFLFFFPLLLKKKNYFKKKTLLFYYFFFLSKKEKKK